MIITTNKQEVTLQSVESVGYNYVHVIQKVTNTENVLITYNITADDSTIVVEEDGYYIISEIKLTTTPGAGYYISGGVVYNNSVEVSIEDLLEVDGLDREDYDEVLYSILETYYKELLQSRFLGGINNCTCSYDKDKLMIDILTMGIDLVKILIKYGQYFEAGALITQLSLCSSLTTPNCGCND